MIKHIVFFKFKATAAREQAREPAANLSRLEEKIPCVRHLEVAFDAGRKHNSYDLALVAHFDGMEDLEAYAVHPEYAAVA